MHLVKWNGSQFRHEWILTSDTPPLERAAFEHAKMVFHKAYQDKLWDSIFEGFKQMNCNLLFVFEYADGSTQRFLIEATHES